MTGQFFRFLGAALLAATFTSAARADAGHAVPGQISLQESVTPIMDSILAFHDHVLMWIVTAIVLLVLALLVIVMIRFNAKANPKPATFTHNTLVEIIWTVVPILILVVIAIPSFAVLTDQLTIPDGQRKYLGANIFSFGEVEVPAAEMTIKATGAQWYWTYEYVDQGKSFDSNILSEAERLAETPVQPRLLAVDNMLVVPVDTTVRVQVTATDVIHAFAVPSFGIKIDAVPGRLNETWFNARKTGVYYGQCSELCGKDHAFMPIAVRVVTKEQYQAFKAALEAGSYDDAELTLASAQ